MLQLVVSFKRGTNALTLHDMSENKALGCLIIRAVASVEWVQRLRAWKEAYILRALKSMQLPSAFWLLTDRLR